VSFLILAVVFLSLKLLVFEILLVPLHQLADALTHVSDEPNAVEPPHPNSKHARANGLAPLLELIYKLGAITILVSNKVPSKARSKKAYIIRDQAS
jgi:hypothetical protein